jgi:hypothetical protein
MKSDMPERLVYVPNEVGWNLYLWSGKKGKPSRPRCAISAHGATSLINNEKERSKLPAGVRVVFYGPHGYTLQNPTLYKVIAGLQRSHETVNSRDLGQDYDLSKSQDTHQSAAGVNEDNRGTGESYKFIGEQMHFMKRHMKKELAGTAPAFQAAVAAAHDNYERRIGMDVVTVRNRKVFSDITLFQVINTLWKSGYRYEEIHCIFCRGEGQTPGSWNPTGNTGTLPPSV